MVCFLLVCLAVEIGMTVGTKALEYKLSKAATSQVTSTAHAWLLQLKLLWCTWPILLHGMYRCLSTQIYAAHTEEVDLYLHCCLKFLKYGMSHGSICSSNLGLMLPWKL